uniref:Uncharacterized protein n=1 Tax=Lepeophtheirus salmonis TaxID=72036 RepID=A0A0K2SXA3_LEPSM
MTFLETNVKILVCVQKNLFFWIFGRGGTTPPDPPLADSPVSSYNS